MNHIIFFPRGFCKLFIYSIGIDKKQIVYNKKAKFNSTELYTILVHKFKITSLHTMNIKFDCVSFKF